MVLSAAGVGFGDRREGRAIRALVERTLAERGVALGHVADGSAPLLVHGGVPPVGAHVWNGAALPSGIDCGALADYLYVAVATNRDRERIGAVRGDVAVVPSWLTAVPRRRALERRQAIGVQANADALGGDWYLAIRELRGLEKVSLSFGEDAERGAATLILQSLGEGRHSSASGLEELAAEIGSLRLLVCTSLDVAILAYVQGVPFLLRDDGAGAGSYFAERGLDARLFTDGEELLVKARASLDHPPDWSELVERDAEILRRHVELVVEAVRSRARVGVPEMLLRAPIPEPRAGSRPPDHGRVEDPTSRRPEENLRVFLARLEVELLRLHREVASQCSRIAELAHGVDQAQATIGVQSARIAELAAEVDRLQREIHRREDLIEDMRASRIWRLAASVQGFSARLRASLRRQPA